MRPTAGGFQAPGTSCWCRKHWPLGLAWGYPAPLQAGPAASPGYAQRAPACHSDAPHRRGGVTWGCWLPAWLAEQPPAGRSGLALLGPGCWRVGLVMIVTARRLGFACWPRVAVAGLFLAVAGLNCPAGLASAGPGTGLDEQPRPPSWTVPTVWPGGMALSGFTFLAGRLGWRRRPAGCACGGRGSSRRLPVFQSASGTDHGDVRTGTPRLPGGALGQAGSGSLGLVVPLLVFAPFILMPA